MNGSTCTRCGAPVVWMAREGHATAAPFQPAGQRWVTQDTGALRLADTFVRHLCSAADLAAVDRFLADLPTDGLPDRATRTRRLQQAVQHRDKARAHVRDLTQRHHDHAYGEARQHPCPQCWAEPGQPCMNLAERRKGVEQPTKHPHPQRLGLVDATNLDPQRLDRQMEQARQQLELWNRRVDALFEQARLAKAVEGGLGAILQATT